MLGAIIGDIVGSRFEWDNIKTKDFEFFHHDCDFTDDSIMTLAVAKALLESLPDYKNLSENAVKYMQQFGRKYQYCDYGTNFFQWLFQDNPQPYQSWGNGAAMRVSACGFIGKDLREVKKLARLVTEVSHNHPEGLKGAEATAIAIYLARKGKTQSQIRKHIQENYYDVRFCLDDIRAKYTFDGSCQGTVPQALVAFFEAKDFEDAIRNAISIGGDSDTLAAITGSVAEAYFHIPPKIAGQVKNYLSENLMQLIADFYSQCPKF